tara:strand:- start:112 stop:435 length:324 start_codon:yes stop_codon:yes gene_type:complete
MNNQQADKVLSILNNNRECRGGKGSKLLFRGQDIVAKLKGTGASISTKDNNYSTTMIGSKGETYKVSLWSSGKLSCGCQFFRNNDLRQELGCKHTIALSLALEPLAD